MSTFAELQKNLLEARGRKAMLEFLADLLEADFLAPNAEAQPRKLILMEDKVPVPASIIDTLASDLLKEVAELDEQIVSIMNATLQGSKTAVSKENVQ